MCLEEHETQNTQFIVFRTQILHSKAPLIGFYLRANGENIHFYHYDVIFSQLNGAEMSDLHFVKFLLQTKCEKIRFASERE